MNLHGYFRARIGVFDSLPVPNPDFTMSRDGATDAAFGFMRLRLEPSVVFGSNPYQPVAALRTQIDLLDNVVFGDNTRLGATPLFANDPSATNIFGLDAPPINVRRLWLEFMTPIGQIRIGRMGSQGGLGLLFNDGGTTAFGATPDSSFRTDFGDMTSGTTFDRVIFLTRPLSIVNTLGGLHIAESRGPDGQVTTPLVLGLAYDWLAEDVGSMGRPTGTGPLAEADYAASISRDRSRVPYAFLGGSDAVRGGYRAGEDDVWQTTLILAWSDPDFNLALNARDELLAGLVMVHRGQAYTGSDVWIGDLFYRLRYTPVRRFVQLYSEGEIWTIQGRSNGVALTGDFCNDPPTMTAPVCTNGDGTTAVYGRTATTMGANVWGGAMRLGIDHPNFALTLESGFSTGQGDNILMTNTLTQRPNNSNYILGMLLYPVVLAVRTANSYPSPALWSGGGVWNSVYFVPQVRYRPLGYTGGIEVIGQFILGFADQFGDATPLNGPSEDRRSPGPGVISSNNLLGWELDLALKISWGPHDEMRWSNEFGIMGVGDAIGAADPMRPTWGRLTDPIIWTLQTRIGFVF